VAFALIGFMAFVTYAVVVPYISVHQPFWLGILFALWAYYLLVNIVYNYWMASHIHPGNPPKSLCPPVCYSCENHKPFNAHHCSICDECVMEMDHHCVWIGQCVGARNHRHFLQFLAFLTVGCATFLIGSFDTFYYNCWNRGDQQMLFCSCSLAQLPWYNLLCSSRGAAIYQMMFFTFSISFLLFIAVGTLFYWNFVLISAGETYIGFLKKQAPCRVWLKMIFFPLCNENFKGNWRSFLGLHRSSRSFIRHVAFPSGHIAHADEKTEDEPISSTLPV